MILTIAIATSFLGLNAQHCDFNDIMNKFGNPTEIHTDAHSYNFVFRRTTDIVNVTTNTKHKVYAISVTGREKKDTFKKVALTDDFKKLVETRGIPDNYVFNDKFITCEYNDSQYTIAKIDGKYSVVKIAVRFNYENQKYFGAIAKN